MNNYNKKINMIYKDDDINDIEKIDALKSLLNQVEQEYNQVKLDFEMNYSRNEDNRSRFAWWQMIATVCAGIVTMATATKSLETNDILTINNLICAISGTITAAGIGSMFLEEIGIPITKQDRKINKLNNLAKACDELRKILGKMEQTFGQNQRTN